MMVSAPGTFTDVLPLARRPMERVFFANTDSEGPVSSTDGAIDAAHRAVGEVKRLFNRGKSSALWDEAPSS